MKNSVAFSITGFALIAVSYGLARFAWGLMLPDVTQEMALTPRTSGTLAGGSFAAYCMAVTVAPWLISRTGVRNSALLSAMCAATGLLLLAIAHSTLLLAAGLFIAGLSAGFSSPALAAAVSQLVAVPQQTQINTIINAGTSAGIMISVPLLAWLPGGWRVACVAFALCALLCLLPLWRQVPGRGAPPAIISCRQIFASRPLRQLISVALIIGITSAAWWSFGPTLLKHRGENEAGISLLWLTAGAAGILGVFTGPLAGNIGMLQVFRLSLIGLIVPLLALALCDHPSGWFFPAVLAGGAGYVALSGVLLVWGAEATQDAPAIGVSILFFMLAAGQMAGSLLFGQLYSLTGATAALLSYAAPGLLLLLLFRPVRG